QERSSKFRQHYPQLTEHFLKAGHCPHDEIPEQVNELIRQWSFLVTWHFRSVLCADGSVVSSTQSINVVINE
ncbi:MAG: hypothetical protein SVR94_11990, partial [Pseudomonadota bacterium]|nr:hypothetical protein [Pseudomonadota bacterium]